MSNEPKITIYTAKDNSPVISIYHEHDLYADIKLSFEETFKQSDKLHVTLEYDDPYFPHCIDLSIGEVRTLAYSLLQWLEGK